MILEQGDVIMVDFNPSIGYEPAKIRPAVVVSGYGFNSRANLVAVVPTTTKDNGYPLHLPEVLRALNRLRLRGVVADHRRGATWVRVPRMCGR